MSIHTDQVVDDEAAAINSSTNSSIGDKINVYDYGGNPLLHSHTDGSARLPAFGGEFQPGLYRPTPYRQFANPAPLGLCAFALTTFVLSLINIKVRGVAAPNIIVSLAFGYGGFVQLCAGMWYVLVVEPTPFPLPSSIQLIRLSQGDGCRQHLRCYRALVLRWILDLVRYYLDTRWLCDRQRVHEQG